MTWRTPMSIEAKVAAILSPTSVVINAGSNRGVEKDAIATVVQDVRIPDPDDPSVVLGTVRQAAIRLRVYHIQEKLSIATPFETVADLSGKGAVDLGNLGAFFGQDMQQVTENR